MDKQQTTQNPLGLLFGLNDDKADVKSEIFELNKRNQSLYENESDREEDEE